MKTATPLLKITTGIMLFTTLLFAKELIIADTTQTQKSYLIVRPDQPVGERDSVSLRIIIGTASNSCWVPAFSNTAFVIEESSLTANPRQFIVRVTFTEEPFPEGKVCTAVYDPVDYGPSFILGKLRAGTYQVIDQSVGSQVAERVYGSFTVGRPPEEGFTIKGTVYDDPYPLKRASMPVPKATVYLKNYMHVTGTPEDSNRIIALPQSIDSTTTDERGVYSFQNVPADVYQLVCTHPEYRTIAEKINLISDTICNFILVSNDANASVVGQVTRITSTNTPPLPLDGYTVTLRRSDPSITGQTVVNSEPLLTTITNEEGRYTFTDIPIAANGEIWYIQASKDSEKDIQRVALYNMRTDTVNFTFSTQFGNSDSVTVDGIVFTTATDKFIYRQDEPVNLQFSIHNTTDAAITFGPFSQGCEYDLIISPLLTEEATQLPIVIDDVLYRESDLPTCSDAESNITVDAGGTVVKKFPTYYLPDLKNYAIAKTDEIVASRTLILQVVARLRGEKYDDTRVGVTITVHLNPPPVGIVNAGSYKTSSSVALNTQKRVLELYLAHAQSVSVVYYTLTGAIVPGSAFTRQLSAGNHTLALQKNCSRGVYIVAVSGTDFKKRFSSLRVGN